MADDYYGDQPRFQRRDPLGRWAWIFMGIASAALLFFLLIIFLFQTDRVTDDALFGQGQGFWIGVATVIVVVALLGLVFVIVGRLGATSGGGYLAADVDDEEEPATPGDTEEPTGPLTGAGRTPNEPRPAARIDDPFGPDGRMLLSYTVPPQQPRGIYGDAWVPVDDDTVLNVKSLLVKTSGGNRG